MSRIVQISGILILSILYFACETSLPKDQVIQLSPTAPAVGDQITVLYNSNADKAILKNVPKIILHALVIVEDDKPQLIEREMEKDGGVWKATIELDIPDANLILIRFVSAEQIDHNAENGWHQLVFDNSGEEREKLVRNFMAENKYTFRVLYDNGFVDKYGVTGIPTKFIIDRDGKIQYKSVGFDGAKKMMDEMTMQIDLLLTEKIEG